MLPVIVIALALLLGSLQFYVRRRLRFNATHFVRVPGPELSPLQEWTLAVIAGYLMPLELPVNVFRPAEERRVSTLTGILARDWSVKDRPALSRVIDHLRINGHRVRCAEVSGRPAEDFLAWDLWRVVLLAWAGVNLGWIEADEFQSIAVEVGSRLQSVFPTWKTAASSYNAGFQIWAAEGRAGKLAQRWRLTLQALLHDPESPWKHTAWQMPLAATIAK